MDKITVSKINDCIARIKNGELNAVSDLHTLLGNRIRFIALKYMKKTYDADDEVQNFWADIVKYCNKCKYLTNGFDYLTTCFENQCKMRLRSAKRHCAVDYETIERYEAGIDPGIALRQIALKKSFDRAKERMTEEERIVFALTCYGGENVRAIAEEIGKSKSQTERIKQKAMEKVKTVLIEDGWDKD